jgi:hypothetical protein
MASLRRKNNNINNERKTMFEIGSKHGNWQIISENQRIKDRKLYQCRCVCGAIFLVREEILKAAKSTSCRKCMYKTQEIKSGDKFGKWTIVQEIKTEEKRKTYIVQCECGFVRTQKAIRLRFGDSLACRTCGSTKHKMAHSKTYTTWESMIQRCTNPNNTNYKHYGARGIKVCEIWLEFNNFIADMGERPENMELDRIDNDGNYAPGNCRWISHQENLLNRKRK